MLENLDIIPSPFRLTTTTQTTIMEYMPELSPSSCSDETLIGTPESPSKTLLDAMNILKIIPLQEQNPFGTLIPEPVEVVLHQESEKKPTRPQLQRRNAISNQSSNDDTIVCHGPLYGAVFGNVSGGAGNLAFESSYFAAKKSSIKKLESSVSSSPSIAYYLSPTYGLPENPFDSLPSPSVKEAADVPDDVRSAFSSDESSESEEVIASSSRIRKVRRSPLTRSPASFSLSTLLDHAPSPPIRSNDEKASLSAPCGENLIRANRRFFDAIQANNGEEKENFHLTLPGEEFDKFTTFKQRKRQSSQRITLQQVALQAGHIASLRRHGLGVVSR
ncbi:uncharacterized protein FA14DRAFT_190354 [Meira miltonrushii]|uniref:Uncharacterized protein n=1 Tax=Meira miltonrushii TaxID=1280837 RepID=A0A316V9P8_9BASI|nr:uncharacterized protein FA14DRAFT_190354 [Meira miltonrushii]PWN33171.1 hypothetical protein FA14DRAFT_190354 [Meira miltonrushii]